MGELVGVGSGGSSGVAPVEGMRAGVDGDEIADQGRSGVMLDVGLSCGPGMGHGVMSALTNRPLKRSAHDKRSRSAHLHRRFTIPLL